MDPWSKVDYSRLIREASMAMEKLPEMNPPSGRVTGQGLLAAPILKRRRRRKREEIAKKGSVLEGFRLRCKFFPSPSLHFLWKKLPVALVAAVVETRGRRPPRAMPPSPNDAQSSSPSSHRRNLDEVHYIERILIIFNLRPLTFEEL